MTATHTDPAGERTGDPPAAVAPVADPPSRSRLLDAVERYGLVGLFVLVFAVFALLRPQVYPTVANWSGIGITQSVTAVAAMALIIPLNCGRFDFSVGSNMVLSSIFAGSLFSEHHLGLVLVALLSVLLGGVFGLVNGCVIAYLGVNSFVATLATATIMSGVVIAKTSGVPITTGLSPRLLDLGVDDVLGIPALVVIAALVALLVFYLLTQTPFGRYLSAVGSNVSSATLVGIPVRRLVLLSFVASGLLGGLGGLMLIALQGNANPSTDGVGLVLPALAAAFLGATAFTPGKFNVPGSVVGLFFVAGTVSGLATIGAQPWIEPVFNGVALVVAVALSVQVRRRRTGAKEMGA